MNHSLEVLEADLTWLTQPVVPGRYDYLGKVLWKPEGRLVWVKPTYEEEWIRYGWEGVAMRSFYCSLRTAMDDVHDETSAWCLRNVVFKHYGVTLPLLESDVAVLLNYAHDLWPGVWGRWANDGQGPADRIHVYVLGKSVDIHLNKGHELLVAEMALLLHWLQGLLQKAGPEQLTTVGCRRRRSDLLDAMGKLAEQLECGVYSPGLAPPLVPEVEEWGDSSKIIPP